MTALPPISRQLVRGVSVVAVFGLVGLTAWRPLAAVPAIGVIIILGLLDFMVVTRSPAAQDMPSGPLEPGELDIQSGLIEAAPGLVDAPTQVLPRITFGYARHSSADEPEPDAADVHTMAIDMRGYLDETGPVRMH